ncbi:MAG TPA: tetratricopeptide repeat protein [Rhizomicrobium sp.]|nr:tetratricopeptide repeat protein [Rhizomicrobium sp.]
MKLILSLAALLAAAPAYAATTMIGDTPAIACAKAAAAETPGAQFSQPTHRDALAQCDAALSDKIGSDKIVQRDRTATLVNRGIILAAAGDVPAALDDYNAALERDPSLTNAYINRGSALLRAGRYTEARADFDRAITMGTNQPTLAYFNRGIANEKLGALTAAYRDYKKAQSLSPDFAPATAELARFQVTSRVAANR